MGNEKKARRTEALEVVEEIVTCSCTHGLKEHSDNGCTVADCDCEIERDLLLIEKVQAIDEL